MESNDRQACGEWFELRDVSVIIGQTRALSHINIEVIRGEVHVLAGKYGEGKTTLCSVLAGEIQPDSGTIRVEGKDYPGLAIAQARALGVEKASDRDHFYPHFTAAETLSIGKFRRPNRFWWGNKALNRDIEAWLDDFGIKLDLRQRLWDLSKEERLFVKILTCLYNRPRLLILDEALERLAPSRMEALMPVLRRYQKEGMSVLWATYSLEAAWNLADRISVIRHGDVVLSRSPRAIDHRSLIYLAYADNPDFKNWSESGDTFQNIIRYTETILRDLPTAIVIIDTRETIQFVNNQGRQFLGGAVHDAPASLEKFLGPENGKLLGMIRGALAKGTEEKSLNLPFLAPSGECLVDAQVRLIRDGESVIGVMLMMEDVSERETMRRKLILANALSSTGLLAAGVAHEVNNPLEVIGNYLSFLQRRLSREEEKDAIGQIREEASRIQAIVNNLVAFSSRRSADDVRMDLHEAAVELAELLSRNSKYANVVFSLPRPDFKPDVAANPGEIRQMFVNLFRNSLEAMPDGGTISLRFENLDGRVRLAIADTGTGIDPAHLDEIFFPFVSSKKENGVNQGLGLSIVHSLVEKFGGSISAGNIPSGGCEFKIVFPLLSPVAAPAL